MEKLGKVLIIFGVLERCQKLLLQCPQKHREEYENQVAHVKHILKHVKARPDDPITFFLFHLLAAATRGFEGYDSFVNFRDEVIPFFRTDPLKDNRFSLEILDELFNHPPQIYEFDNLKVLNEAKRIFYKQKMVISNLSRYQVAEYQIDKFFEEHKIYYFIGKGLRGLSTYNGKTTYVNMDQTEENQRNTLLHEWSHNFPRFLWKNKDPLYLSPKKNRNLRMYIPSKKKKSRKRIIEFEGENKKGRIVEFEGGEYFDYCALNIRTLSYTPFAMLLQK